jgi:predicted unusual protein kinase regulating ubiquinone biosynthesis (AarF/ABC1/UbiB family)
MSTSAIGRMRRTATSMLRASGALSRGRDGDASELDAQAIEKLAASLGELKGIAMKMGQILSYVDPALPEDMRRALATLQAWSPPVHFEELAKVIQEDLGVRGDELLAAMDAQPVSAASIGQVHRARLGDASVAVKVLYPEVEAAIRADFRAARFGTSFARLLAPGADVKEIIAEARARFLEECDYELEAARQRRFAELFATSDEIAVPRVHDAYSSRRVLTTAWYDGLRLEELLALEPAQAERDALGRALYEFFVGTLYRHGLFHADPHPGNLLFAPSEARVTVLDYGCVREFDTETVAALIALSAAVRADDAQAIRDTLVALGANDPGTGRALDTTRALLRGFYGPTLEPGARAVDASTAMSAGAVMRTKRDIMRLRLPGKLLFLFRIRFGLYALLSRLGARVDWHALERGHAPHI